MKTPITKKNIVEVISYLYILLFFYAAISKLLDHENFEAQIGQSPLLSTYAWFVSWGVVITEILTSVLLAIPKFRYAGLYIAFNLMVMFTVYIILILNYSSHVPCSCGGILEDMGWKEHLWFNISFTVLAVIAIVFLPYEKVHLTVKLDEQNTL